MNMLINAIVMVLAAGCFASNPITFTAEAVGEKIISNAVESGLAPLHEKIDTLADNQKTQSSSLRLLMESFSRDRAEWQSFRNVIYQANKDSDKLHKRWERYLKTHGDRIAKIEKNRER